MFVFVSLGCFTRKLMTLLKTTWLSLRSFNLSTRYVYLMFVYLLFFKLYCFSALPRSPTYKKHFPMTSFNEWEVMNSRLPSCCCNCALLSAIIFSLPLSYIFNAECNGTFENKKIRSNKRI
jgi:hypothetical protein